MKGVHWIDTGQWPSALAYVADESAYKRLLWRYCGKGVELFSWPDRGGGFCQQLNNDNGDLLLVIGLGKSPSKLAASITVAHEATHAMWWILQHACERDPGTETEAYLVEHIMRGVLNVRNKPTAKAR